MFTNYRRNVPTGILSVTRRFLATSMFWTVLFSAVIASSGCSDSTPEKETGTVTGVMTLDGKPVTKGEVRFSSDTLGAGATAMLGEGGTFTIDTPIPVGEYVVCVGMPAPIGPQQENRPNPDDYKDIPQKYAVSTTSDLKATVAVGENKVVLDMKK
ncbi:MAG: hypothetical protein O3A29_22750 [Planctomycetota bacterium]|nr:hypothetical protein [Planctomycetota bacterium]